MSAKKKSVIKRRLDIEKLSWFSSIFSFLLGLLVWLIPNPEGLVPVLLQNNVSKYMGVWQVIQTVLFSMLIGFGINTIVQAKHEKMKVDEKRTAEELNIKISVEGDWWVSSLILAGLSLLFLSALMSLIAVFFENVWLIIPTLLFFLPGVYALSFLSWDFFDRIKGKITFTGNALTMKLFSNLFKIVFMLILTVTAIIILLIRIANN